MGTRGYYAFKFRGKYYIFYNHWDSYPKGLGKLVLEVYTLLGENRLMELFDDMINKRPVICPINNSLIHSMMYKMNLHRFDDEDDLDVITTSDYEPECDLFIEYIYVVNLDAKVFVMKSSNNSLLVKFNRINEEEIDRIVNVLWSD